MTTDKKIKVGISIGDINGIGIELILKTFSDSRMLDFCTPIIFGSGKSMMFYKKLLNSNLHLHTINNLNQITDNKINVINCWREQVEITPGISNKIGGKYAFISLSKAVEALKNESIDVLLTSPINKENIQSKEFDFAGHTEYLEKQLEGKSLMILMTDELKVGLITGHIPISEISKTITPELIEERIKILYESLVQDFQISKPKIAILGLNPHCGDKGVIGKEDDEVIRPTIQEIQQEGKLIYGPFAADGFFGAQKHIQFDAVLAMYHDQGLAPFKTLSFGKGVNFTAGLNKIRTSPDHGTAFEIAGKGIANNSSFIEALYAAIDIYRKRENYIELMNNSLNKKGQ